MVIGEERERLMSEIDEILASYTYDEETVWETYKDSFLRRSPQNRDAELKAFDQYAETKMDTPSRETADLLTRKRELLSIHGALRKLGR
jgi:hypothetical protein